MKKRIFAWVLLAGFVLLILNLIVFRFYWQFSMVVYLIIVFAFLLTNGKLVKTSETDKYGSNGYDENTGIDELGGNNGQEGNDLLENNDELMNNDELEENDRLEVNNVNAEYFDDDIITDTDILGVGTDNDNENSSMDSSDNINSEDK